MANLQLALNRRAGLTVANPTPSQPSPSVTRDFVDKMAEIHRDISSLDVKTEIRYKLPLVASLFLTLSLKNDQSSKVIFSRKANEFTCKRNV